MALTLGLCLGAPFEASAEPHFRLRAGVRTGGGWSDDLFLGAGLGASAQAVLAPSLAFDASLASRLKLFCGYDLAIGYYGSPKGNSFDHEAQLGARLRLASGLWLELAAQGELQDYSVAQAVDAAALGIEASSSRGLGAAPGLRWYVGGWLVEATGGFSTRRLSLQSGEVIGDQTAWASLGAGTDLGPLWAALALRGIDDRSEAATFSYRGASASLVLAAAPTEWLLLRATTSAHRNSFALGRNDTLVRAGIGPVLELGAPVSLETAYSFAANFSSDPAFDATRHFVYLGIRVEGDLWRR